MNNSKNNLSPESYCLFSQNSKGSNTQVEFHNKQLNITPFPCKVNDDDYDDLEQKDIIQDRSKKIKKKSFCENYAFNIIAFFIFLVCIYKSTFSNKPFY
jgi:hypothetical protein